MSSTSNICNTCYSANQSSGGYFDPNECICELLISYGNCENCLHIPGYCTCEVEYIIESDDLKKYLTCPISYNLFIDPVVCSDGHTYEKYYIEEWLEMNNKSPMTGEYLTSKELIPNYLIKSMLNNMKRTFK